MPMTCTDMSKANSFYERKFYFLINLNKIFFDKMYLHEGEADPSL